MTRLRPVYFIVANTVMLLLLVDLGTDVAIRTYQRFAPSLSHRKLTEAARSSYAHMTPADVDDLLGATSRLYFHYVPLVGFVEGTITSRFVNIDEHGIRSNGKTRRDVTAMQDAIWFFGGSTALGYGVADRETIPAQLEEITGRPVINLGVRGNAAAMETRLMTHYLRIGYRPATVIFLDGINESCEAELFEHEISVLVDRTQHDYDWQFGRPVAYAWARITNKLRRLIGRADPPDRLELTCAAEGRETPLQVIHERTLAERDALCRLYAVACRTMVQPFAGVHVRNDDPAFPAGDATYLRELWAHLEGNWRAARATFVTAALEGRDDHAFVDSAHYNAAASRLIAAAIALNLQ